MAGSSGERMKPRKLTNDQVAEIQQLAKTQMKKIDIAELKRAYAA